MKSPKQENIENRMYDKLVDIRSILNEYAPDTVVLSMAICENEIMFFNSKESENRLEFFESSIG